VTGPAIRARDLGIRFFLRYQSRSTVHSGIVRFLKSKPKPKEFWALRNVSFEVEPGEVFGIIGANGSGKSTLLRTLSRIYYPDEGELEIHGKVSSLISLGAGFQPELTGLQNIYYNGMILGLSRSEIDEKQASIIDFAGIDEFIDAPVRTYSSGMRARLGFSVAVHVDPEVLVVDEVLVVGDAAFRQRCIDKMEELMRKGATVVMVQHNLEAVIQMCHRVMWLDKGVTQQIGEPQKVINEYLASRGLPPIEQSPITTA
jgi:ABC-type polysaccharide/polyol phosphate transport system ATPase subunit